MEIKPKNYKKLNVEKSLSLIQSVKSKEIIWNKSSKDFKNKRKQDVAWNEVATRENCAVQEAKHQWSILLSCFRTYKAKVKKSIKTEKDINDVYRPCWFAYEPMMFTCEPTDVARHMVETMSAVRYIRHHRKPSPELSPPEQIFLPEENSCPQFPPLTHENNMGPVFPDVESRSSCSVPSPAPCRVKAEVTYDQVRTPQAEDNLSTIEPSLMDLHDGTKHQQQATSAVIGNEVARWIETFEPRVRNLAIGKLYIAMHQIEKDVRPD